MIKGDNREVSADEFLEPSDAPSLVTRVSNRVTQYPLTVAHAHEHTCTQTRTHAHYDVHTHIDTFKCTQRIANNEEWLLNFSSFQLHEI